MYLENVFPSLYMVGSSDRSHVLMYQGPEIRLFMAVVVMIFKGMVLFKFAGPRISAPKRSYLSFRTLHLAQTLFSCVLASNTFPTEQN